MPANAPALASDEEQARLIDAAEERFAGGAGCGPVVRELLCAGVEPWRTRRCIETSLVKASRSRSTARSLSLMSFLGGRLWGSTDKRDVGSFDAAMGDLDAWVERFGEGRAGG